MKVRREPRKYKLLSETTLPPPITSLLGNVGKHQANTKANHEMWNVSWILCNYTCCRPFTMLKFGFDSHTSSFLFFKIQRFFSDQRPFYTVKPYCDLFPKSVSNSLVMADWFFWGPKSRLVYSSWGLFFTHFAMKILLRVPSLLA